MRSYGSTCLDVPSVREALFFLMKHLMLRWRKRPKWQLSSSKISGRDNKKYVCNTIIFLKKSAKLAFARTAYVLQDPIFYAAIKEKNKKKKISKPQSTLTSCWSHLSNEMLRIAISYWEGCMFFLSQGKFWNCFDVFSVKQFFITLMLYKVLWSFDLSNWL